jgi:hypothetical protein
MGKSTLLGLRLLASGPSLSLGAERNSGLPGARRLLSLSSSAVLGGDVRPVRLVFGLAAG